MRGQYVNSRNGARELAANVCTQISVEASLHAKNPYDISPEAAARRKIDPKEIGTMVKLS